MDMRMRYYEEGKLVIKLKEEPGAYYDDKRIEELPQFVGHSVEAYYSEKGELVEVHIGGMYSDMPFKQEPLNTPRSFTEEIYKENDEIMLPDILPLRKYVFTFGRNEKTPKACADHYNELWNTDDRFMTSGRLIIQRRDGKEMDRYEIEDLRGAFFKDAATEWGGSGAFYDWSIESVYKDKKLYFWTVEEKNGPDSIGKFIESIKEMLEVVYFDVEEAKERELGADIITTYNGDVTAAVCIADEKSFEEDIRTISREELIKACKNTSEYKKRKIVLWDELSDDAKKWAKSQGIEVQDFIEFIAEFCVKRAEINDKFALSKAKEWEKEITEIFG